jgi:2-keto-4-pentenoate hydratase/2-oxohepta-3-ene-1,7-dioic acid hydratase in catechol pathway
MRYLTFSTDGDPAPRLGVLHRDRVVDVRRLPPGAGTRPWPASLLQLIQGGPKTWREMAEFLSGNLSRTDRIDYTADAIRWHAPIPRPTKNVVCVGLNYLRHAEEGARAFRREMKIPPVPIFFTKAPTAVRGPYDDIVWEASSTQEVDWEAELGVIIGTSGRNISRNTALQHVFGYTIVNDVTARDLQRTHSQFYKGKSLDTFCPIGPVVVTTDEFGDPQAKHVALRVNSVTKQEGTTADMIFPVDQLIESLSIGTTVEPGDIIATGTPEGVGFARIPPEFLRDGDIMETEVEGIGVMRNRMVVRS